MTRSKADKLGYPGLLERLLRWRVAQLFDRHVDAIEPKRPFGRVIYDKTACIRIAFEIRLSDRGMFQKQALPAQRSSY